MALQESRQSLDPDPDCALGAGKRAGGTRMIPECSSPAARNCRCRRAKSATLSVAIARSSSKAALSRSGSCLPSSSALPCVAATSYLRRQSCSAMVASSISSSKSFTYGEKPALAPTESAGDQPPPGWLEPRRRSRPETRCNSQLPPGPDPAEGEGSRPPPPRCRPMPRGSPSPARRPAGGPRLQRGDRQAPFARGPGLNRGPHGPESPLWHVLRVTLVRPASSCTQFHAPSCSLVSSSIRLVPRMRDTAAIRPALSALSLVSGQPRWTGRLDRTLRPAKVANLALVVGTRYLTPGR